MLPFDVWGSFLTKALRMVNYGAIAPVFFLYCTKLGFDEVIIGTLLTCILIGDVFVSLYLTTRADTVGRRMVLVVGSGLKILAGLVFAFSSNFWVLLVAGVVGVISTSGGECGPLMPVEKAILSDAYERYRAEKYTKGDMAKLLGWYNAVGYAAQAIGALLSGVAVVQLQRAPFHLSPLSSYRCVFVFYAFIGFVMAALYGGMSRAVEAQQAKAGREGHREQEACCPKVLHPFLPAVSVGLRRPESFHIITRLSFMFAMDAFAGAFVLQTWVAYWFHQRWGFQEDLTGYLLMGANVVAGLSSVCTSWFVNRFGPMLTMIASHFPSNLLLLSVPLMPTGTAAAVMLVARFCISQMDVPARDTYVNAVVASDEKSAANGITGIARSVGMSLAPLAVGYLSTKPVGSTLFDSPFMIAGVIKCFYDVILYGLYLHDATMTAGETTNDRLQLEEGGQGRQELQAVLLQDAEASDSGAARQ